MSNTAGAKPLIQWPFLVDLKPGDLLIADAGFPCIPKEAILIIRSDEHGLWVHCCGPDGDEPNSEHYLDGQLNETGEVIGFQLWKKL